MAFPSAVPVTVGVVKRVMLSPTMMLQLPVPSAVAVPGTLVPFWMPVPAGLRSSMSVPSPLMPVIFTV